ncbi:uncharacterized protein C6G9.01c [Hevea brasiliensis]|uniref:uncharacterized protein C6G9.01c n=1 Tax=Hevea brasiliensis TaxID=3981 RepID=UPI0025FF6A6A|nr:uncharacterized protein C6G9.01c [Hevea brasiliensis]XP_021683918.2 uncharacterized protein C6G9.01c [Hevea brasiliensis]
MPKKNSSKATLQAEECTVVGPEKPTSTLKKPSNEIDEIFSGKKRKKPEKQKNDKANETESDKPKSLKKKKKKTEEDKEGRLTDPPSRHRKKTKDGLNIYTEEELGINHSNAGGTPLCPFDCDCCF